MAYLKWQRSASRFWLLIIALFCGGHSPNSFAGDILVTVQDPFMDMRTGPGRGYPVFHVVLEGEEVEVIKRKTDWFRIRTTSRQPKTGWVHLKQITRTIDTGGARVALDNSSAKDAVGRTWEWSMAGGELSGAPVIATGVTYRLTRNLAVQAEISQILGDFSDGYMAVVTVQHSPFPHWRFSPYFQLGAGFIHTEAFSTIVQAEDQNNQTLHVGGGVNLYLTRRLMTFIDYRYHTVLTSRDNNEELSEWKVGFSIFL